MKRSQLRRRTPLKPGESLRRKPPRRREGVVSLFWRRDLGPCVVCPFEGGVCRGPVQGHHLVSQSTLRKHGLTAYLNDLRNRLPICEHRHEQHTTGYRPIPRAVLPASVFEFADAFGLGWYLDKHYPVTASVEDAA